MWIISKSPISAYIKWVVIYGTFNRSQKNKKKRNNYCRNESENDRLSLNISEFLVNAFEVLSTKGQRGRYIYNLENNSLTKKILLFCSIV